MDAFNFRNHCLQHISGDIFDGFEDCLYLNVYVPINTTKSIDPNAKLPVIFYIYGGRFVTGAANDYAPDFLMEENVIVVCKRQSDFSNKFLMLIFNFQVTSNHRVGPLGFLALNLPEYSGNMGLKDQSLALRWVNENIGRFGGDVTKITICGHSSGKIMLSSHQKTDEKLTIYYRISVCSITHDFPTFQSFI